MRMAATGVAKYMMGRYARGHHSEKYDTRVAQCAIPLHADIAHGTGRLHTEMMPLRMAYRTNSAVLLSPRDSRM
jgi:hypothetical protein